MSPWLQRRRLGGIGLLLLPVLLLLTPEWWPRPGATPDRRVTVLFAHWQLESGLRDAFDALAAEYMTLHPNIAVVQRPVPDRIFATWLKTRLVGNDAPDLIQFNEARLTSAERARYFVPLGRVLAEPNPYNQGTDLANTPWRDTFIDRLDRDPAYDAEQREHYAVPNSMFTLRVFYNRDLLREITGTDVPPSSYRAFIAVCEAARLHALHTGRSLAPLAGSRDNAPKLLWEVFSGPTLDLRRRLDPYGSLPAPNACPIYALAHLRGEWGLHSPEIRAGLEAMRELARYFRPGFLQMQREDGTFDFLQGRAVFFVTGSWDAPSLLAQAPFAVGAMPLSPYSPPDDATRASPHRVDPFRTDMAFGLTRSSRHQAEAIDFLRFITSRQGNATFVRISRWLPAVVGVEPDPALRSFMPQAGTGLPGFLLPMLPEPAEPKRIIETEWHRLFSSEGSVDAFVSAVGSRYREALITNLRNNARTSARLLEQQDAQLVAEFARQTAAGAWVDEADPRLRELIERHLAAAAHAAWIARELASASHTGYSDPALTAPEQHAR